MSYFIVSDVHLHPDFPEISKKFADFVGRLSASDTLIIGGDLCDFSLSSRQRDIQTSDCAGLTGLQEFRRRGGELILVAGNHDAYMEQAYRRWLDVGFVPEPLEISCFGFHLHVLHGHLTGPRSLLKTVVASKQFHDLYSRIPRFVASRMEQMRISGNIHSHAIRCEKFMSAYRQHVLDHTQNAANEIFVFGHIHEIADETVGTSRMIVLGEWEDEVWYLRIDQEGANLILL